MLRWAIAIVGVDAGGRPEKLQDMVKLSIYLEFAFNKQLQSGVYI